MGVVCMLVVIVLMSVWTNVGIEIKGMLNEFPWMVVMGRPEVIMLLVDKVLTISVHIVSICVMGRRMSVVMVIPLVICMVWRKVRTMLLRLLNELVGRKIVMSSVVTWLCAGVVMAILVHVIGIVVMGCIMVRMIGSIVSCCVLIVVLWCIMDMPV
jgi:hypothetical protein